MKEQPYFTSAIIILLSILVGIVATPKFASAAPCIPEGATIYSATFSIYVDEHAGQEVRLHRVTAPWSEMEVTWDNFGGSYDSLLEGSFVADGYGWRSVDVTELVQEWVNGVYPNYGFLLEQEGTQDATYSRSSEYSTIESRPKLEICYSDGLEVNCVTIQRPGVEQDGVTDAYIWELAPDYNGGDSSILVTGSVIFFELQSLVRFEIETCPKEEDPAGAKEEVPAGTEAHGYWKTHPEAWPVDEISIGGISYNKDEAISFMRMPVKGDKTVNMFRALVSAKLNVIIGNEDDCIVDTILDADDWMGIYGPVGSGVKGKSVVWHDAEWIHVDLDDYNNGLLCAPHRD